MQEFHISVEPDCIIHGNAQGILRNIHSRSSAPGQSKANGYASATGSDIQYAWHYFARQLMRQLCGLPDKKFRFRTRNQCTGTNHEFVSAKPCITQNILYRFIFEQAAGDFIQPNLVFFRNMAIFAKQYIRVRQPEALLHNHTVERIPFGRAVMPLEFL